MLLIRRRLVELMKGLFALHDQALGEYRAEDDATAGPPPRPPDLSVTHEMMHAMGPMLSRLLRQAGNRGAALQDLETGPNGLLWVEFYGCRPVVTFLDGPAVHVPGTPLELRAVDGAVLMREGVTGSVWAFVPVVRVEAARARGEG